MEKKDNIGMRVACDLVDSSQKKIEATNEMCKKQSKERGELNKNWKSTIERLFSGMKKKKEMWFGTYFVVPWSVDTIKFISWVIFGKDQW